MDPATAQRDVVIGGHRRWRHVLACAALLGFGILAFRWNTFSPLFYGLLTAGALAYRWGDEVRLEPDALVVVHRSQRRSYPWEEFLELSWRTSGMLSSGPVARTVGTVWDTPGPAAAAQLGEVLCSRRHAEATLIRAAEVHGIPYTPELTKVLSKGRLPGLPSDAVRRAR